MVRLELRERDHQVGGQHCAGDSTGASSPSPRPSIRSAVAPVTSAIPSRAAAFPAIANAIHHATGRRVVDLPITIDKLL